MNEYYRNGEKLEFVKLSHAQETALFESARAGDEESKEFIIRNHLLLAAKEGRKYSHGKLPEDEVVSVANYALMRAYETFDHTRGNRFASFLRPFVRGRIVELWRAQNTVGEHARKFEDPEDRPIAAKPAEPVVYQTVESDDHDAFMAKLLEDAKKTVLTAKERIVVERHYGDDEVEMARIARELGLTRSRVHQIKECALRKLNREVSLRLKLAGVSR